MSTSSARTVTACTRANQGAEARTVPMLAGMESLLTAVFETPVRLRTGRRQPGALHLTRLPLAA